MGKGDSRAHHLHRRKSLMGTRFFAHPTRESGLRMGQGGSGAHRLLRLENRWQAEGHRFVRWCPASRAVLRDVKSRLAVELKSWLSSRCVHVKGRGGAKQCTRYTQMLTDRYPFVARFDIRSYYESMDHGVLLTQLQAAGVDPILLKIVEDYLSLPDTEMKGKGMVAGGAISPLLGAVYLTPLDRTMEAFESRLGIKYQRFMDDFVIFAPTRHKLRAVLREMYRVLDQLKLNVHPNKRYIGTTQRGFDFLGYRFHPGRKLRPSQTSLNRLFERARRLQEQGADITRLRQYVQRWFCWLHGGLLGRVSIKGRFHRIWISVVKHLARTPPMCPAQQSAKSQLLRRGHLG